MDWWEGEAKERYLEKTACVIDQFNNFTVEVLGETLNVNGINTQGYVFHMKGLNVLELLLFFFFIKTIFQWNFVSGSGL